MDYDKIATPVPANPENVVNAIKKLVKSFLLMIWYRLVFRVM